MTPPAPHPTVLVVEDDASLREFFVTALRLAGLRVAAAADGSGALRWIAEHTPALIVLDLTLVCVSGRDVQRELRSRAETRNIPVVIVTGGDASDLNPAEVACVLHKPVSAEALVVTVQRCLRRASAAAGAHHPPGRRRPPRGSV